uniref:C2H2-type domain-containing protein n=1 Tax=Arion vulgaris TaxID=1028688 RepID=A0A0B7AIP2_9EUPU
MDSSDEIDIFDSSADLFDESNTYLPALGCDKPMNSQSLLNGHKKLSHNNGHLQLDNLSNTQKCINTVTNTPLLSSDKPVAQLEKIAPIGRGEKKCSNEHFNCNLCIPSTEITEISHEDSFEGLPKKRHKLYKSEEEFLPNVDLNMVADTNYAPVEILNVSNHSSDESDVSKVSLTTSKEDSNIPTRSTFSSSGTLSNEEIVKTTNSQQKNIASSSENQTASINSDYTVMNGLNNMLPRAEIATVDSTGEINTQIDSEGSSNIQTTSLSNNTISSLPTHPELICPFCNLQQDNLYLMEIHIDIMHSETSNDGNKEAAILKQDDFCANSEGNYFQFICPLCDLDLGDRVTLDVHLLAIHEEEQDVEASEQEICPLCGVTSYSENNMKLHIKSHAADQTVYGISETTQETVAAASTTLPAMTCPVCELKMTDTDLLISHVESHFNSKHSAVPDHITAESFKENSNKENVPLENSTINKKDGLKSNNKINTPPTCSKKVYPSTSQEIMTPSHSRENVSYKRHYEKNLERAVTKGEMSVTDYHEQKLLMAETDMMGVDNGSTRTRGLIEKLGLFYHKQARQGQVVYLCAPTDHYSGSYGDTGWGCGYRNFQMILSCLSRYPEYAQRIFADNLSIPSIPKLQQIIETAWKKGFDPQGCRQLRGQLVNTSKWIGATEIVATLSSLGIKCLLVDFHAPSAPDGTHPLLLEWVSNYFCRNQQGFLPPLYLQHQGHSRTIVGVEKDRGTVKLLLFDPGTPSDQLASIARDPLTWKHMRTFRRTQAGFRARQYQIVAITSLLADEEYEESKILKSEQVS